MKQFISNHKNYSLGLHNRAHEVNTKPSQTVPNMTLSLKDLLARYVQGGDVAVFTPVYLGDADMPPLEQMSEMDRKDMAGNIRDGIDEFRNTRKKQPQPSKPPESHPDPEM